MRTGLGLMMTVLAAALSACNLVRPEVTLTLAPIDPRTPQATPVSASPTASPPPTRTARPTPTRIIIATATPTPTATPLVGQPQALASPSPSATASDAPPAIPSALASLPATWTAAPTLPPTRALSPPPDSSAHTPGPLINASPAVSTPAPRFDAPTATPTSTATRIQPTVALRRELLPPVIQPRLEPSAFSITASSAYEYDVGAGQVFRFEDIQLGGGVRLFLRNPVDAGSFMRTDAKGMLRFKALNAARETDLAVSPFFAGFAAGISSIDENKNRIVELDWSADGTRFSFRIDPPAGTDTSNAGLWFWQPATNLETDPTYAIIRDCPAADYRSCAIVNPGSARFWRTIAVQWSPVPGDNLILLTLELPEENRNAVAMVEARRDPQMANNAPAFIRYDYASWNADGQSITVSGRDPGGRAIIALVDRGLEGQRLILDGAARGLWLRDAVRLADGSFVALGRYGGPGSGPLALFDGAGEQISDSIGDGPPQAVRWFPDRSAVVLSVDGQQYTAYVEGGSISNVTALAGNPRFSAGQRPAASIPAGVMADAEYQPGQQLRVAVAYLNLRQEPSASAPVIGALVSGDYVAIFAGPHEADGYRWWRVQTADDLFGWVAGGVGGAPTLRQP